MLFCQEHALSADVRSRFSADGRLLPPQSVLGLPFIPKNFCALRERMKFLMNTSLAIYFCGHEQCGGGHSFGPAVRPHYLIHFVLRGRGLYRVNGSVHRLLRGDAFLIYPGETTYYEADPSDPWEYTWIGFGGQDCPLLLSGCDFTENGYIFRGSRLPGRRFSEIQTFLGEMLRSFEAERPDPLELLGYFCLIFSRLAAPGGPASALPEETYLRKALDYIHNNYSYPIHISGIARQIGIDRSYLYKLMQQRLHLSPQQYLIEYRLSRAKEMLAATSLSVTEIAFSCGFKDTPSFCRLFKKRTGASPGAFRRCGAAFALPVPAEK